jgi:hypothetical protein
VFPTFTDAYSDLQTGWERFSVDFLADCSESYIDFQTTGPYDIESTPPSYPEGQ